MSTAETTGNMASGRAIRVSSTFRKTSIFSCLCSFQTKQAPSLLQNVFLRGLSTTNTQPANVEDDLYSKIMIEVKGHDSKVLDSYYWYLKQTAYHLDLGPHDTYVQRKPTIDKLTLNKSVHVFKKHRVQYEARTHHRSFIYYYLTGSTANTFLEYIQRNLPEGIAMKVTKFKMERLPEHLQKDAVVNLEDEDKAEDLLIESSSQNMQVPAPRMQNIQMHRGGVQNRLLNKILMSNATQDGPAKDKAREIQGSEQDHKEMISSEPEHKEVISSEPEHKEVIASEPEHKEMISSEPENKEVIASEPEHKEVIASEPEHKEVIASEPEHKEVIASEPEHKEGIESEPFMATSSEDSSSSSDSDSSDSDNDDDSKGINVEKGSVDKKGNGDDPVEKGSELGENKNGSDPNKL
ncbi:uncharacterized protein LOC125650223 isoform X2 [Ostrea edulis]|uniref:uncharacterized protein LOC125650223 isoform X2 n=1 Tax=Ostrea edulis TaxID=37623 RepID=UPI0024AF7A5F|nr:uncharacterized protein LOC125650223 isoform X2 [Ostrea edulis]